MTSYIAPGIIFLMFLVAFKILDKRFAPPAIIFVLGFVSATFLYSFSIIALNVDSPTFAWHNFDLSVNYSTASFASLLLGYIIHGIRNPIEKRGYSLKRISLGKNNQLILLGIILTYFIITLVNHPIFSGVDYIRGENTYINDSEVDIHFRVLFIVSQTFAPLILASYVISFNQGQKYSFLKKLSKISIAFLIILNLLAYDRHQAMSIVIMVVIFYHYRVRSFAMRHIFLIFLVMLLLQAMRAFRQFGVSIANISLVDIGNMLLEIDWVLLITGPFVAIGGWDVLTNVFDLVPTYDGYKYGTTYLSSLVGLAMPRALGLGSYGAETPSVWYVNLYAPGTIGHGFDFSMIAETYINFGFAGCLVFVLFGILLRIISRSILCTTSPVFLIFSIITIEVLTFALRMDSNALLKGIFFKAGAIALLISILQKNSTNQIIKSQVKI